MIAGSFDSPHTSTKMSTHRKMLVPMIAIASLAAVATARGQDPDELDPLGDVIVDMQVAGGRLAKLLTDKPTQQKQKDATDKLDALIKLFEKRRQQQGAGGANPDEPLDDSRIMAGPGGSGPLHAPNRRGGSWGDLPAHKRQQILQSMTEGFPPHYQPILERYYRRLAEEKPAGETAAEPRAGVEPAPPGTPASAPNKPDRPTMKSAK
jgi:hypothetical protein